ncbi:hypothetical protein ABH925_006785 [Streptacidiphilus sp. EB129]
MSEPFKSEPFMSEPFISAPSMSVPFLAVPFALDGDRAPVGRPWRLRPSVDRCPEE